MTSARALPSITCRSMSDNLGRQLGSYRVCGRAASLRTPGMHDLGHKVFSGILSRSKAEKLFRVTETALATWPVGNNETIGQIG